MSTHTPAPWRVDYDGDSMELILSDGRKPVEIVCALRPLSEGAQGEELANARLIAAAPELLAALESLFLMVDGIGGAEIWRGTMGDDGQGHDEGGIRAAETLFAARAAIKKAKGCGNCGSDDVIKAPVGTLDKDWLRQQWLAKSKEAK